MTKVDARASLDTYLATTDWTLLLVVEDAQGAGAKIHDKAETAFAQDQTQRKTLLFADTALLTPAEAVYGLAPGRYAVLARHSRAPVQAGPLSELMEEAAPSIRAIRRAFHHGDQG